MGQDEARDAIGVFRRGLGTSLKRLRNSAGLTLGELAEKINEAEKATKAENITTAKSSLSQVELGQLKRPPNEILVEAFIVACEAPARQRTDSITVDTQIREIRTAYKLLCDALTAIDDYKSARIDTGSGGRSSVPRVGHIPLGVDGFQERVAVEELAAALEKDTLVSIVGMGGVGKTQLAARYARRCIGTGDVDLIVWVDASSCDAIVSRYAEAGVRFAGADPAAPGPAAERFLAWLETTTQRWLIVLDNLDQVADLDQWWPPTDNRAGRTIVTARRRDTRIVGRGHRLVEVDVFTDAEAHAYLRHGLREPLADDIAGVAADLGWLPLALGQAAAYMSNQDVSCGEYRRRFADHRSQRLADLIPERDDLPRGHPDPVAVTWSLSIEAADSGRPVGLARPVLELASVLAPDAVPTSVFTASKSAANWLGFAGSLTTGDPPRKLDAATIYAALRRLHQYSLADVDRDTVRVHTLVQRAVRDDLPAGRLADVAWAAAEALTDVWPDSGIDPDLNQRLRASAEALNEYGGEHLWDAAGWHEVLDDWGKSLGHAGQAAAAAAYFHQLSAAAEERFGPDHYATLAARHNLAIWQIQAYDAAGLDTARQLVADRTRLLGRNHPDTHTARHTLGLGLGRCGDWKAAVVELESLLADRTKIVPLDHPATLILRHNLAMSRGEAGDPAAAVAELEAVLADTERVLGPEHHETLSTRHELARWRSLAGDPSRAAAEFAPLVIDRLRLLGRDHPQTLLSRSELAITSGLAADDPVAALAAFEALLADRIRVLGPDHPETLDTRLFLIIWRFDADPTTDVVPDLQALLDDVVRVLGPRHSLAHSVSNALAVHRNKSALTSPHELLATALRVLGPDHPEIWAVRMDCVQARTLAGDPAGAVPALEGLVSDLARQLGPDHPFPLMMRDKLAETRHEADDLAGAIADYEALLADRLRILGPEDLMTLGTRNNLARERGDAGDAGGAVAAFEELLEDCLRVLGAEHACTVLVQKNLEYFRNPTPRLARS